MCTVTYVPTATGCLLTSSRDEKAQRPKALVPAFYQHQHSQLLYPKDAAAGGSWITVTDSGTTAVLLNGGFIKHTKQNAYRKSRGLILLDIACSARPLDGFQQIELEKIEPFTLVLFFDRKLFECRWDGNEKHVTEMDAAKRHIWSSVTLYPDQIIREREVWFSDWCVTNPFPGQEDIVNFHKFGGNGNIQNSIRMNRNADMLSVSITSIFTEIESASMLYYDLQKEGELNQKQIQFKSLVTI